MDRHQPMFQRSAGPRTAGDRVGRPRYRAARGLRPLSLAWAAALLAGLVAAPAGPVAAAGGCGGGRVAGPGGHSYQLVCTKRTFAGAKSAATAAGGHLVTIGDAAENAFVFDLANVPGAWSEPNLYGMVTGPWIGFAQAAGAAEPAGGWGWVTGEPVGYTNWASGEPNDFDPSPPNEDRGVLWGPAGAPAAVWNDLHHSSTTGYVVEFEPKPTIDWTMPERLTTETPTKERWALLDGLPGIREVNPEAWTAQVFLKLGGARYACPAGKRYAWRIEPLDGGRVLRKPDPGCAFKLSVSRLGRYAVTATRETRRGGKWQRDAEPTARKTVLVKDFLIVGLGDSNGSGEGNPASFYYDRCNRGTASYQFQTALYVEEQDPRTSVTFVHASCSGARIEHLVGQPYAGIREASPPLRPQIEQVSFLLSRGSPRRSVDAVLVSAGVNDLAFGPVMKFCVLHGSQTLVLQGTPCPELGVFVERDGRGRVTAFQPNGAGIALRDHLDRLVGQLRARYPALAGALKAPIAGRGGLDVAANRVFLTQYPDFMRGADGDYCDTRDASQYDVNWGRQTWTWLSQLGGLLNQRVRQAATSAGWHVVAPPGAFATRGYCNLSDSLVVGVLQAFLRGNGDGAFHPTAAAHLLARDRNTPLVCQRLYGTTDCTGKPR